MTFLNSYFARLALLVAALPLLIMGGALSWTYQSTAAQFRAEHINQINDDLAGLVEVYAVFGPEGLTRAINNRLALTPSARARAHYALSREGIILAGDMPENVLKNDDYVQFTNWTFADNMPMLVRSTPLRGGEVLHVARNDDIRQNMLAKMRRAFVWLALLTLGLGLLAGAFASRMFKRRIKTVNDTCAKIGAGHLDERVTLAFPNDEIGVLGGNVNDMLERISGLIRVRKNIADHVAHELRSPLTRLDAKLIEAAKACDDPNALNEARDDISNCITLLDSLLDVSALEAQSGDKSGFEPVDLTGLANNICEFYRGLAEDKGLALIEDIEPSIMLDGDPMQLSRLLANLLDNAIKYTPSGGEVTVDLRAGPVLSVQDTGPGIPDAIKGNIFTPFFRARGLSKSAYKGHGLGLALCLAIAKRHDLKITVQNANLGACFVVGPKTRDRKI